MAPAAVVPATSGSLRPRSSVAFPRNEMQYSRRREQIIETSSAQHFGHRLGIQKTCRAAADPARQTFAIRHEEKAKLTCRRLEASTAKLSGSVSYSLRCCLLIFWNCHSMYRSPMLMN